MIGISTRLALIMLVVGLLCSGQALVVQSQANATVSPVSGPAGTQFLFFASGFQGRERISAWLNLPGGQVMNSGARAIRASNAGDTTFTWEAPADATLGQWSMVAHGINSGLERVIVFQITPPPPPDRAGNFNVQPQGGRAGTTFQFYASGFTPQEVVDLQLIDPRQQALPDAGIGPAVASATGRADWNWTSPNDAQPGNWRVVARGLSSGYTLTITFEITPQDRPQPRQMIVSPLVGTPGMRFRFAAEGFWADERIHLWLNMPGGGVIEAQVDDPLITSRDGRVAWTWVAPENAARGRWQMVAHGQDSAIEQVGTFEIR